MNVNQKQEKEMNIYGEIKPGKQGAYSSPQWKAERPSCQPMKNILPIK